MFADRTSAHIVGGHPDAVVQALLAAPVAAYELVLAMRLISRGFDSPWSSTDRDDEARQLALLDHGRGARVDLP